MNRMSVLTAGIENRSPVFPKQECRRQVAGSPPNPLQTRELAFHPRRQGTRFLTAASLFRGNSGLRVPSPLCTFVAATHELGLGDWK